MGYAYPDAFKEMYDKLKGFIPEAHHKEVANIIYDAATDVMGCNHPWNGDSNLERDGRINQNLKD